eukprot:COSAG05_NODE_4325_length_1567_cov_1.333106_4_plen_163_part_00
MHAPQIDADGDGTIDFEELKTYATICRQSSVMHVSDSSSRKLRACVYISYSHTTGYSWWRNSTAKWRHMPAAELEEERGASPLCAAKTKFVVGYLQSTKPARNMHDFDTPHHLILWLRIRYQTKQHTRAHTHACVNSCMTCNLHTFWRKLARARVQQVTPVR